MSTAPSSPATIADAAHDRRGRAVARARHRIDCWLFVGNEWLIVNPTGAHVANETRTIQTPPTIVPAFTEAHLAAAGKIVGPSDDHDLIARLTALLQKTLAGRADAIRSQPD